MAKSAAAHLEQTMLPPGERSGDLYDRYKRWCRLNVDGVAFGDHDAAEPHFEETALLAIVLVSCDVDTEIASVRRLPERQTLHTADYEATLKGGRIVRIEVTQFNDKDAMTYQNQWNAVFNIVQAQIAADSSLREQIAGLSVIFEFPHASPTFAVSSDVAAEVVAVLRSIDRDRKHHSVPETFPSLHYCGATYRTYKSEDGPAEVRFRLPLGISDAQRILDSVPLRLAKKAAKHKDYSDDEQLPVWLAVFARDEAAGFNLTAIQTLAETAKEITVEPFERLMIANTVAGLLVDADRQKPAVYRSLTVQKREIDRSL